MIKRLLKIVVVLNVLCVFKLSAQTPNTVLKQGDPTPALILYNNQNTQQSISFPYINKVVLLHFWSSSVSKSKPFIPRLLDIHERYSNAVYRNADGFEAFTIAVQSDRTAWNEDIVNMKMEGVSNLIAPRGYNDLTIRNFKITQLPLTLLISETGQVLMVNPTQLEIEDVLDGKKNSPVNTKDLKARLLFSEAPTDAVKNHKMVLKNKFGDTLSRTTSDNSGVFTFYGVKFLKDYIIKLDTSGSLQNISKAYLSTSAGAVFGMINKTEVGFELPLTLNEINKMNASDKETMAQKNALTVNPNVTFKAGTAQIDEGTTPELDKVVTMMAKNKEYTLEIIVHTDSRGDDAANLELSKKRASAVKTYLVSNGIVATKIRTVGKGETMILNKCKNNVNCTEAEHLENNRVELKFIKP